MKNDNFST